MRASVRASVRAASAPGVQRGSNATAHAQPSFSSPPWKFAEGNPFPWRKGLFLFPGRAGLLVGSPNPGLLGEQEEWEDV